METCNFLLSYRVWGRGEWTHEEHSVSGGVSGLRETWSWVEQTLTPRLPWVLPLWTTWDSTQPLWASPPTRGDFKIPQILMPCSSKSWLWAHALTQREISRANIVSLFLPFPSLPPQKAGNSGKGPQLSSASLFQLLLTSPELIFLKSLASVANNGEEDSLLGCQLPQGRLSLWGVAVVFSYCSELGEGPRTWLLPTQHGCFSAGRLCSWGFHWVEETVKLKLPARFYFLSFSFTGVNSLLHNCYLCPGGPNRHSDASHCNM